MDFQTTTQWILNHGYTLMFLLMLIEGPNVTAAGAFAAALGYFNGWAVIGFSILGNLIPDVIFYAIGFWGRKKVLDKYVNFFRVNPEKIARLEKLINENPWKALFVIKFAPLLATPGLIAVGALRMPLKRYIWIGQTVTVPVSTIAFFAAGYFFGTVYDTISSYINYGGYLLVVAAAIFGLLYYAYKKVSEGLAEKIEKI